MWANTKSGFLVRVCRRIIAVETNNLPNLYFARMDVGELDLSEFMYWYDTKHAPDLIDAGFHSAQAYHCYVGGPLICNVYEIDDSEIFYTSSYQQKRTAEHDPQRPRILEMVSNRSNTVYLQVATAGVLLPDRRWDCDCQIGAVEMPVISTTRFEVVDGQQSDIERWFSVREVPRLVAQAGFGGVRLCRQSGRPHPANPSGEPEWVLLSEWDSKESVSSVDLVVGLEQRMAAEGLTPSRVNHDLAIRMTRLRNGDT